MASAGLDLEKALDLADGFRSIPVRAARSFAHVGSALVSALRKTAAGFLRRPHARLDYIQPFSL